MTRFGVTMVTVFAILMAVFLQQAFALTCWYCQENDLACTDPFDGAKFYGRQGHIECNKTFLGRSPVCLKVKSLASRKVYRYCSYSEEEAFIVCKAANETFNECEFCNSTLCNGAAQHGPAVSIIMIPLAILKMLSL